MHFPHTVIHWTLAATATAAVIFFAAGLNGYFEAPAHRGPWLRALHYLTRVGSVLHLAGVVFVPPRSDVWAGVGIALYCAAVAIHLSSIEAARRTRLQRAFVDAPLPDRLIIDGPYRWVRHPFYVGYILGAAAAPAAVDSLGLVAIALLMVVLTVTAAFHEERAWLAGPQRDKYQAYQRRTAMFFPFVRWGV